MQRWHIHISGQVQGVGFRPFVYRLAIAHQLNGWVNNTADGVHIEINATERQANHFYHALVANAPDLAQITRHRIRQVEPATFAHFSIRHSTNTQDSDLLLTPDFSMCDDCCHEITDSANRRQMYAFTTCTHCGPRYSITRTLPYDRETTTMKPFTMCSTCAAEYQDPLNRRYYSQTNSCLTCPVEMTLLGTDGAALARDTREIIDAVCRFWSAGKIVAVKGIGGYLATCDASNKSAIQRLRKRKKRPSKPFALMFGTAEELAASTRLRAAEREALSSVQAPIVLLEAAPDLSPAIALADIAPGIDSVGVMMPYTPLFALLMEAFGKPIVATSANVSNAPIIYDDTQAAHELPAIADSILSNNRAIVVPQDDSVVKYTARAGQRIVMRRARGIAPTMINAHITWPGETILCTGAMLKSTFTLLHRGNTYVSQYLGDLENFDTLKSYQHTVTHFLELFDARPDKIIVDLHPEYPSTIIGEELAADLGVPCDGVQHHVAHFSAVLAENNCLDTDEPVLGVIWDGTGLGEDGNIWGGEFFLYQNQEIHHLDRFAYFSHILGNKMAREPRISALSACHQLPGAADLLRAKFSATEWKLYNQLLARGHAIKTSSAGRIFDAAASILGVMDQQTYEGEAAMHLETLARSYLRKHGMRGLISYLPTPWTGPQIPTESLFEKLIHDTAGNAERDHIAANFHHTLSQAVRAVAESSDVAAIAFSGGVMQNGLLADLLIAELGDDYRLLFHNELSPNDECVSYGQLVAATQIA